MVEHQAFEKLAAREAARYDSEERARLEKTKVCGTRPVLTISRDYFCGGQTFSRDLSRATGWRFYDKDIVDTIAEKRKADSGAVAHIDEKGTGPIEEWANELFVAGYLPAASYTKELAKIVAGIAVKGDAIIAGRGANFLLPEDRRVAVRLTAPPGWRIENYRRIHLAEKPAAKKAVEEEDRRRAEFIRRNFGKELNDPLGYDLVINTSVIDFALAKILVLDLLKQKFGLQLLAG